MSDKSLRQLAAMRSSTGKQPEALPELHPPMATEPREGLRRGRAVAARYAEDLALHAAAIAFGDGTKSLHTRVQAMQLLQNMIQAVPEPVSAPRNHEPEEQG